MRNRVVLTNRSRPGSIAASAARSSTSRSSARWRSPPGGSGSTRPSSRAATCPRRRDALPHALGRALRLGRLRGVPRPRARARRLRRAAGQGRRAAGRGSPGRDRARVHRRAVDLEHGLHHARADRRGARAALPKSGNAEGASIAIDPHGGITVRLASTPQGQGHRTVCAQVVADVLGCEPEAVTVMSEMDTASVPWTVASGNYSSRFSGVAVGAVQAAALKLRAKIDAIREHAGDESLSLRRVAGHGALESRGAARRRGARAGRCRLLGAADARPARRRRPRCLVRRPRLHRRHLCGRGRSRDGRGEGAGLRHRPRRRPAAQSAARRRAGARRVRSRGRGRALRAARLRRVGQPDDGVARRLPRPDRTRHPGRADRASVVDLARDGARRQGHRRGQHDERPRVHRERRRRRDRPRRRRAAAHAAPRLGASPGGGAG